MSVLKNDISATFASNVFTLILSLGTSVILARMLGPADRGLFGLAVLIPTIGAKFCSMGQETVNNTFAGLYRDKRKSLFLQSLIMTLAGTVVCTLVVYTIFFLLPVRRGQFDQIGSEIIWLSCLVTPFLMLSDILIALVKGIAKIIAAAVILVVQKAVFLALLFIFLVLMAGGVKTAIVLTGVNCLIGVALSIWVVRDYVTLRPSKFTGWLFKKSLVFGGQINLATFGDFLHYRIDQIILAYMVPIDQLGLYVVAVGLSERIRLVPDSISCAFLPRLANEVSKRQSQVPKVFRCATIIALLSMILAGIFGVPAILVLFGWRFLGVILPFLLLLPGSMVLGVASVLANDLVVRNRPKYNIWVSYLALTANILFNIFLIPLLGIVGAAVASSLSYTVEGILWLVFFRRESGTLLVEMLPRWQDALYVLNSLVSVIRMVIVSFQTRFKPFRVDSAQNE